MKNMSEREKGIRTKIGKGMYVKRGEASELQKKPGMSNVGKYKNVAKKDFAGKDGSYPINTEARARSALGYAHNSPDAASIKRKVYSKYPGLKKRHDEREGHS